MSRLGLGLGLSKGRAFSPFDPLSLNPILAFEASRSMLAAGDAAAANLDLVATLENRAFLNAVETGSSYGTSLSGSLSGSTATHNQVAPAVAGEFYRIRFTASNVAVRGRVRYRNYAGNADVLAVYGLGSLEYFYTDGAYEAYIPSDDGLSLWFYPESGWDYSDVSVQQISKFPANATQVTANKQPRAHVPVGDGHLYLSGVSGNYASVAFPAIGSSEDFVLEMEVDLADVDEMHLVSGSSTTERIIIYNSGTQFQCNLNGSAIGTLSSPLSTGLSVIRCERASGTVTLKQDGTTLCTLTGVNGSANFTQISKGNFSTGVDPLSGSLKKVTLSVAGTEELNIDFSDADHKASSFDCSTGQTVTINTSGNDPATIVRRPFLRLDGASSFLSGTFNETNTTGGYLFVVYSVNGDGGQSSGRVFVMNSAGEAGYSNVRSFLWSLRKSGDNNIAYYHNQSWRGIHTLGFDPVDGILLHEVKAVDGSQFSKVNNGDIQTSSLNLSSLSSEEFDIGSNPYGTSNYPAIDLEALYLFDETLTDEDATKVRDYLNAKSSIY